MIHPSLPSGRRRLMIATAAVSVTVGAAAPAAAATTPATEAPEPLEVPTIAWTSPTQPTFVERDYGLLEVGPSFGLDFTPDDLLVFESHAVATQTVLSGGADIVGGSFVSTMLVNQQGQDFKAFCPFIKNDDFVLVTTPGIDTIADLFEGDATVAVDSPGGAGDVIVNAMIQASGDDRSTTDLPNVQIIESSGLRTSAFVGGEVNATMVHLTQYNEEILPNIPDAQIISSLWEDVPVFMKEALAAPAEWLDENLDVAAAVCASIISGARTLAADPAVYVAAVNDHVDEPPSEAELTELFELIATDDFWPLETGVTAEHVTVMGDAAVASGALEEVPAFEDVVDPRPFEMALELVGEG
ncbi:ABC transporter substrate-binding protein [Desertimonas flava]|uniref:ABC transporter substrate-binding protein n=1 Tax=Desertimonas flava TaxID=2064846 RepID=UPI0013C5137B|nr:ABC transporter substrate-binding protein [Desertimonas flava]